MKKAPTTPKTPVRKKTPARRAETGSEGRATPRLRRPTPAAVSAPIVPLEAAAPPTEADVARRAYEIFLGRNGGDGDPVADWLQAERELLAS